MRIPFTKVHNSRNAEGYLQQALSEGHLSGDGSFTGRCQSFLEETTGCRKALLTHSCTGALEMACLLAGLAPGDEVIMPSFTFSSTANAAVLRGATPVFVDIRPDTLNLDEKLVEEAATERTRAVMPVHYAGVGCAMDEILRIADRLGLAVIEDAAQCLNARYKGRVLGTIGDYGALSFHATKNVVSGEGGALLVNHAEDVGRAEIVREKGTDRSRFLRGEVDRYTWRDKGSSYLPAEIVAALLLSQLEEADAIASRRLERWNRYHDALEPLERNGLLTRPAVPEDCAHNAHIYYVLLDGAFDRDAVADALRERGIGASSHYQPLHAAPAGRRFGRVSGLMDVTERVARSILRLPLWSHLPEDDQAIVIAELKRIVTHV